MAATLAQRLRNLEYWRNGNGSEGAERRLQNVEELAGDVKTGKACTAKESLGNISRKVEKMEKQTIWILILLATLHAQKLPDLFTFLKSVIP